jgi:hypothetical protein
MRHIVRPALLVCVLALLATVSGSATQTPASSGPAVSFDRYHTPQELTVMFQGIAKALPGRAAVQTLAKTPSGLEVTLLEIGPEVGAKVRKNPAVLVVANPEGITPLASEAALFVASQLQSRPELSRNLTWYIVPALNPDAAARFFAKPLYASTRNSTPHNDDLDDQTDEDGPDDLNKDGIISQMRVKDPMGEWMPVAGDPRQLKKADTSKGEKGIYKLYAEGIDNDGDGEYNEDPVGGRNIGVTFPHLFKSFEATSGAWPGQEAETRGMMVFAAGHPEIAMTMTFGASNFCSAPPRGGRQGTADLTKIKVPENIAKQFGADPNATYTLKEIRDMVTPFVPAGIDLTDNMITSFLGLGAAVNPLDEDVKFYKELSEQYKEFIKAAKLDAKRLDPAADKDGAFELWSYYHLGVPTFAMDFWTLPEAEEAKTEKTGITADSLEAMTNDAFIALGETKITAFLKEAGAPPDVSAKMLLEGVKGGQMTPKQMAGMMRQMPKPQEPGAADPKTKALVAFSDKTLQGRGFLPWTPFKHPTLGEVEIGGDVPYADTTPPATMVKGLVEGQSPWVFTLAGKLAHLRIAKTEVTPRGGGVYGVTVWVENAGYLPFPTEMGKRNQHVGPAIVTLKATGVSFVSGRARTPIDDVSGLATKKLEWLVRADKPTALEISLVSANVWGDAATVQLGGGAR